MAGSNKSSGNMSMGAKGRRSVGAAGGGKPNGAILNDDDNLQKHVKRFKEWAKGYRETKLRSNPMFKGGA